MVQHRENLIQLDLAMYPAEPMPCLRCGGDALLRFAGPCPTCAAELRAKYLREGRAVEGSDYVPKMNVTPNAVALKDD